MNRNLFLSYIHTCCTGWVVSGASYVMMDDVNTDEGRGGQGCRYYLVVSVWGIEFDGGDGWTNLGCGLKWKEGAGDDAV